MTDAALDLAANPENWLIVIILTMVAFILFLVKPRIGSERTRDLLNLIAYVLAIVGTMIWGAYKAAEGERLLAKDMRPLTVTTGGATVRLVDVASLRGWGEGSNGPVNGGTQMEHGDHEANTDRDQAQHIFDRVLREMGLGGVTGAQLAQMDQRQWVSFLMRLGPRGRREVSSIPFATLVLRASDGHERRVILFRRDAAAVRDRSGRIETIVCVLRMFNIREGATRDDEALYLGVGDHGCTDRGDTSIEIANRNGR